MSDPFEILSMGPKEVERQKKLRDDQERRVREKREREADENIRKERHALAAADAEVYERKIKELKGGNSGQDNATPAHVLRESYKDEQGPAPKSALSQFHPLNFINKWR